MSRTIVRSNYEQLLTIVQIVEQQSAAIEGDFTASQSNSGALAMLLDIAHRSMMARGVTGLDAKGALRVDSTVIALIAACTRPEQSPAFGANHGDAAKQMYFYHVPEFKVTQTFPAPGLHAFVVSSDSDMGQAQVLEWLRQLPAGGIPSSEYTVSQTALFHAQEAAKTEAAAAQARLMPALPVEIAHTFAQAFAHHVTGIGLQCVYRYQPQVEQAVVTTLADETQAWLLAAPSLNSDSLTVQALLTESIHQHVAEAMAGYSLSTL